MEHDIKDLGRSALELPDPRDVRELTLKVRWLFMSGSNTLLLHDKERMELAARTLKEAGDMLRRERNSPKEPSSAASEEDLGRLLEELRTACRTAGRQRRNFARAKGLPVPEDEEGSEE